jgi:hypothetical protein
MKITVLPRNPETESPFANHSMHSLMLCDYKFQKNGTQQDFSGLGEAPRKYLYKACELRDFHKQKKQRPNTCQYYSLMNFGRFRGSGVGCMAVENIFG